MSHHQLTPFETALLRAVEDLNATFEAGLKNASASPKQSATLQTEFERLAGDLEKRLTRLVRRPEALRQLLEPG